VIRAPRDAPGEDAGPTLRVNIAPDAQAPSIARAAIIGFCQGRGITSAALATTTLLVSEVVTNAVIHPDVASSATIALYAHLRRDVIRVEVADDGGGFTPAPRDPARSHGGYGLFLLEQEATRWGVEQTPRTKVWFEMSIRAAAV
jgi:anti-sigma regulatory factor (Ser/Thr protein kinase)